ncbi:hypothetical protein [Rubritalea tangerina]|uniref:hypothetical protein n=1 Tax=Rubritalea tangerina TaxID=430798 RepID=UPI00360B17E5
MLIAIVQNRAHAPRRNQHNQVPILVASDSSFITEAYLFKISAKHEAVTRGV